MKWFCIPLWKYFKKSKQAVHFQHVFWQQCLGVGFVGSKLISSPNYHHAGKQHSQGDFHANIRRQLLYHWNTPFSIPTLISALIWHKHWQYCDRVMTVISDMRIFWYAAACSLEEAQIVFSHRHASGSGSGVYELWGVSRCSVTNRSQGYLCSVTPDTCFYLTIQCSPTVDNGKTQSISLREIVYKKYICIHTVYVANVHIPTPELDAIQLRTHLSGSRPIHFRPEHDSRFIVMFKAQSHRVSVARFSTYWTNCSL